MIDTVRPLATEYPVAALVSVLLAVAVGGGAAWAMARAARRRLAGRWEVAAAAVAAALCTAYSGDTAWRFAGRELGMINYEERVVLFLAGEVALLACALLARRRVLDPKGDGKPGAPGLLVWVITGVQLIPAFDEGGFTGGIIRAVFGPILAAVLWHLAMGMELRAERPAALRAGGLLATLAQEVRERALARLGLAERGRTSVDIARDRHLARAVDLAARLESLPAGADRRRRRTARLLSSAVGRSGAATDTTRREQLLAQLSGRRHAADLATISLASPWTRAAATTPTPRPAASALGVSGEQLRRMDPMDAVHLVRDAHPDLPDAHLASMLTAHGVVVSETMVRIALRAERTTLERVDAPHPDAHPIASGAVHSEVDAPPAAPELTERPADAGAPEVHPDAPGDGETNTDESANGDDETDTGEDPDPRLGEAREIDLRTLAADGRRASMRQLQREMRIGQPRATRIRMQLDRDFPEEGQ
ncbi:hypothetical protein [Streptomyces bohaiensis]|uniref:hypothetical protein n=1 Tax=Streptomyces bohaiensis TaxID=1431344 RepID=UPI003B7C7D79